MITAGVLAARALSSGITAPYGRQARTHGHWFVLLSCAYLGADHLSLCADTPGQGGAP